MLTHTIYVVAPMHLISYLLQQLVISGKVVRWAVLLSKFKLHYIQQKSIKGRVVLDLPTEDQNKETFNFPINEVL